MEASERFKANCRCYNERLDVIIEIGGSRDTENAVLFECLHPDAGLGTNCGNCNNFEASGN